MGEKDIRVMPKDLAEETSSKKPRDTSPESEERSSPRIERDKLEAAEAITAKEPTVVNQPPRYVVMQPAAGGSPPGNPAAFQQVYIATRAGGPATFVYSPQAANPNPGGGQRGPLGPQDPETGQWIGFDEFSIRQAFIRRVFLILAVQLTVTVFIVGGFVISERVQDWARAHPGFFLLAYIVFIVVYLTLVCCESTRRRWPCNFIFLAVFTLAFSYLTASIAIQYQPQSVLLVLAICAGCSLVIVLFSLNTRYDITSWVGILVIASFVLFIVGIISVFTIHTFPILYRIYAGLAALLFMLFLAVDTQMLMNNKEYSLSPEEYIFGALQLYCDILMIFLYLLEIFGERR